MTDPLEAGRIVWAEIADTSGNRKLRPAVIVTPTDRITPEGPLDVVAVTSRLSEPMPAHHVLLPWHPKGQTRTRLNRRCVAVCTWVARLTRSDIREFGGVVPGQVLLEILTRVSSKLTPPPSST